MQLPMGAGWVVSIGIWIIGSTMTPGDARWAQAKAAEVQGIKDDVARVCARIPDLIDTQETHIPVLSTRGRLCPV